MGKKGEKRMKKQAPQIAEHPWKNPQIIAAMEELHQELEAARQPGGSLHHMIQAIQSQTHTQQLARSETVLR